MSKVYAGIGSRSLSQADLQLCSNIGKYLAELGWELHTGACTGADQAFAEGALSAGGRVLLFLPWPNYEFQWVQSANIRGAYTITDIHQEAKKSVHKYHPSPGRLSRGAFNLHARNYMIIEGCKFVIAFPSKKLGGGGTGQGLRIAKDLNIEIINISTQEGRERVEKVIYGNP